MLRNSFRDHAATSEGISATSFALLSAASLRLRIVVKKFGHGTEIMKPCQEIVCPVDIFE